MKSVRLNNCTVTPNICSYLVPELLVVTNSGAKKVLDDSWIFGKLVYTSHTRF